MADPAHQPPEAPARGPLPGAGCQAPHSRRRQGWRVEELLVDDDRRLSRWAEEFIAAADADVIALPSDMLAELGEKDEDAAPELLAVVAMPPDDLARIPITADFLGVTFDRPAQPGNLGTLIRSADAFGASGVVVTGHAADVYDPRTVRASTGSLFGLPTVRRSPIARCWTG